MKKCLLSALVTFAIVSLGAEPVFAGPLLCHWRCRKYSTYICVRPYNAFSPVAHGTIHATGCCPLTITPPSYFPQPFGPSPFTAPGFGPMHCPPSFDGSCGGAPFVTPGPMIPQGPTFTPPAPTPINPSSYYWPTMPYGMVRPVGYQPTYYGGYPYNPNYPTPYNPWTGNFTVPSYWYGN